MKVSIGDVVFMKSSDDNHERELGIVIDEIDGFVFIVMATVFDSDLAGHLDFHISMEESGLPYRITVLTHIGLWVDSDRIFAVDGHVDQSIVEDIGNARLGIKPANRKVGMTFDRFDEAPLFVAMDLQLEYPEFKTRSEALMSLAIKFRENIQGKEKTVCQ